MIEVKLLAVMGLLILVDIFFSSSWGSMTSLIPN